MFRGLLLQKIRISICIAFICCTTFAVGQTNKFEVGLEAGPSLISLRGNYMIDEYDDPSFAYSAGVAFQYNFPKRISLRTNVSFERKGFTTQLTTTDLTGNQTGEVTIHQNVDYFTMPLLTRITIGKKINLFANAGPYIGYLIKNVQVTEASEGNPRLEGDGTDDLNKIDYGLTAGLGARFPIRRKLFLSIEIRNNLGFPNISARPVVNNGAIKTNSTNLLIGIEYRIGSRLQKE